MYKKVIAINQKSKKEEIYFFELNDKEEDIKSYNQARKMLDDPSKYSISVDEEVGIEEYLIGAMNTVVDNILNLLIPDFEKQVASHDIRVMMSMTMIESAKPIILNLHDEAVKNNVDIPFTRDIEKILTYNCFEKLKLN